MDSLKQSMSELSEVFHAKMAEFQRDIKTSSPSGPTTASGAHISSEFHTFKNFVTLALNTLQQQLELLSKQLDDMEMHKRRKILLIHGVPEEKKENILQVSSKIISDHLHVTEVSSNVIGRCHRLGKANSDKPRPILLKLNNTQLRNKIWFSKTGLKGTGITLSEFLTQYRHKTFLEARRRFGVSKCWTKNGTIFVLAADGSRHRVDSMLDLDAIPGATAAQNPVPSQSPANNKKTVPAIRSKRTLKVK